MIWLLAHERSEKFGEIEFFVPVAPHPQGRGRASAKALRGADGQMKRNDKGDPIFIGHVHSPQENAPAADHIRFAFMWQLGIPDPTMIRPLEIKNSLPWDGTIRLRARFLVKKTGSDWEGRDPLKRPDMDNYLKMLQDALNGYAWIDDDQVCGAVVEKGINVRPGTIVVIEFWREVPKTTRTKGRGL